MSKGWSTACIDWEKRIVNGRTLIPIKPLFQSEANKALDVFKSLRIVDAPGSPTFGEACEQWVFDFVAIIFGSYDHEEGIRLIREFFLLVSKKNSKSTIAAGIMVTALIRNWRKSAELMILAPTLEVANNAYQPARDMVRADPALMKLLHIQDNLKQVTNRKTKAFLKVIAADTDTVGGKKSAFVFVDEIWLFGKRSGAASMLREAIGGLVSRPEGFVIWSSTQSDEPPTGIFKEKLDYFRNVRDGVIKDKKSLPVIYEFPKQMIEDKTYLDPENFYITNPNLGKSVNREWLEEELIKEQQGDNLNIFLSKHLNIEIGMNLRNDRWPGADLWLDNADENITLEEILRRCEVVTIGIDGGGLDDLLGFAIIGREKKTRKWLLWNKAWCHPIVFKKRKEIEGALKGFIKDGDLILCERPTQDIEEVTDLCLKLKALLPEKDGIGIDRLGLPGLLDELIAKGFDTGDNGGTLTAIGQGGFLNPAIMGLERKLNDKTLAHAGQSLMTFCVGNAKIELKGNARAVTKQVSGKAKIDPLVASFNAAMLMARNPQAKREPEYQMLFVGRA